MVTTHIVWFHKGTTKATVINKLSHVPDNAWLKNITEGENPENVSITFQSDIKGCNCIEEMNTNKEQSR